MNRGSTGTRGLMKVVDNTGGATKTVDVYLASSAEISVPSLPWSYSIDGVKFPKRSFKFVATTAWQHLGKIYVGYAAEFIFHLDATGHVELGGPTDLVVQLDNKIKAINFYVNGAWRKAIPFVYTNGAWVPAVPRVYSNSAWTEVV